MDIRQFRANAKTLKIAVTATASTSEALPDAGPYLRVINEGPDICYISVGTGDQTATLPSDSAPTTTSTPISLGETLIALPKTASATPFNISAICDTDNTATLYVQVA